MRNLIIDGIVILDGLVALSFVDGLVTTTKVFLALVAVGLSILAVVIELEKL